MVHEKILTLITQGLPILYALIGFSFLIIVHECGHFLFCKLFNIHTPTFSIGMGPTLIEKQIGTTNFRLGIFPLGGYVEIAGHEEIGQGDQKSAHERGASSFALKPYWQKFLVMMGGISFNLIFAYATFTCLFLKGVPKPVVYIASVGIDSIAAQGGLNAGDQLIEIGDYDLKKDPSSLASAIQKIQEIQGEVLPFKLLRDNQEITIPLLIPSSAPDATSGKGKLGVQFDFKASNEIERFSFGQALYKGFTQTKSYLYITVMGLKSMITNRSIKGAGGPVMIISESVKQAQAGFIYLFIFLAIISINLAVMNLLPLPILDGGQLLFITIESLIGRELPSMIKNGIFIASWVTIFSLLLFLTYTDILALVRKAY